MLYPRNLSLSINPQMAEREGVSQSKGTLFIYLFHIAIFAVCVTEIISKSFRDGDDAPTPWMGVSLASCSLFLIAGPLLMTLWGQKWKRFADFLVTENREGRIDLKSLSKSLKRMERLRPLVVFIPMGLMLLAFKYGNSFFEEVLDVNGKDYVIPFPFIPDSNSSFVWIVILMVGCYTAGWAVWCGLVTLVSAVSLSKQRGDFSPFAGVTSQLTRKVSRFSFASAVLFCIGGTFVVPAFSAAASRTDGAAPWLLGALICLVVGMAAALLAVPAVVISRQLEDERERYLDKLSAEIQVLAERIIDGKTEIVEVEKARLDSLLDLRSHVMQHMASDSALRLVRLMPLTVLMPVSSALTSWIGLLNG